MRTAPHGFLRVAAACPRVSVANPQANAAEIARMVDQAAAQGVQVAVFPELCLTGYTAGDLFYRRLFELEPSYRKLFSEDMTAQKRKLMSMLSFAVHTADWSEEKWSQEVTTDDDLFLVVLALGRRHALSL